MMGDLLLDTKWQLLFYILLSSLIPFSEIVDNFNASNEYLPVSTAPPPAVPFLPSAN